MTVHAIALWLPEARIRRQREQCYTLALRLPFQAIFVRLPRCRLEVSHAMTPRARRALFAVALFFAVCAVAGSFMQRKVGAQSSADESQLRDSLRSFTSVYAQVEENYAEPINGDRADTAIYDVGMTIQQPVLGGKTYVMFPMEGAPAFKAGIHPGDVIASVDGKSTDGMTSDLVAKALKGPKGTHVQVTMIREGQPKPLAFDLVRDEIPNPSVDLKYEIRPGVRRAERY